MTQRIQTKYEDQLPKLEAWSFDHIFGYITGLASIAGLIAAPFIVKDQSTLAYVFMFFLSLLVFLLIVHAILVERRKLHRYAQTVFHTHFTQHLVRDALSELAVSQNDNIEQTTTKILNSIANCFSITCGKTCRASIIELDDKFKLNVVARDEMSKIRCSQRTKTHCLADNTDFDNLWYSINGCSRYYLNNNIKRAWIDQCYKNSSLSESDPPQIKSILGFTYVKNWTLKYNSALVLPIRYISEFKPPKEEGELVPNWDYYGFLCIDSISSNSFDKRYSSELGACYADMLYTYFNQINYILESMTEPTNQTQGKIS